MQVGRPRDHERTAMLPFMRAYHADCAADDYAAPVLVPEYQLPQNNGEREAEAVEGLALDVGGGRLGLGSRGLGPGSLLHTRIARPATRRTRYQEFPGSKVRGTAMPVGDMNNTNCNIAGVIPDGRPIATEKDIVAFLDGLKDTAVG
ncbi:hypothetical protein PG991_011979 [Apiospora marii]|uniref:Uncharacterized protein n=1 Tax=Apiospora marii TaxID=335849 RepID=A0ABR1RFQ6_9PEZI